jgi:hypothetical protein
MSRFTIVINDKHTQFIRHGGISLWVDYGTIVLIYINTFLGAIKTARAKKQIAHPDE